MRKQVPVQDGLFSWGAEGVRLIGGRCTDCDNHVFPYQSGCPRCSGVQVVEVELSTEGELWTWTIQGYPPKTPPYVGLVGDDFEPFGVGYVELPGALRVEARLTENDPSLLDRDADDADPARLDELRGGRRGSDVRVRSERFRP